MIEHNDLYIKKTLIVTALIHKDIMPITWKKNSFNYEIWQPIRTKLRTQPTLFINDNKIKTRFKYVEGKINFNNENRQMIAYNQH